MRVLLLLAAVALTLFVLLRLFLAASPARLAATVRVATGILLLALAFAALTVRQIWLAIPLAVLGAVILLRARRTGAGPARSGTSSARSAGLEMTLDHATGALDGEVLAGRQEGRKLSELTLDDLAQVAEDVRADPESLRLLETYLDRVHPGWREHFEDRQRSRRGAAARPGGMSAEEAYDILGLEPGATEVEIRQAHRRLIKQVHPDRGGSAALAQKINEAKDRLLNRHG